jgi:hypothetical protein
MKLRHNYVHRALLLVAFWIVGAAELVAQSLTMEGTLVKGSGYSVYLVERSGRSTAAPVGANGRFQFNKVTRSQLRGASLQLSDSDGRYAGPVVLGGSGKKVSTTFSGKPTSSKQRKMMLGKIALRSGYAQLAKSPSRALGGAIAKATTKAVGGKPIGAGQLGLVNTGSTANAREYIDDMAVDAGSDDDQDGIPAAFDADDDGDLILDPSDSDSAGSDVPYTSVVVSFRESLNAHVRSGLSDAAIDAIIGGENVFILATFISLPPEQSSRATGGYIICDDALPYCRPNTPTAYFSGVSESSNDFRRPWAELLTSAGYPRMEKINSLGAVVAAIQPRVGRSQFRPGDVYDAVVTSNSEEITRKTFTLAPYFVSVPALKSYNAGAGEVTVDYNSVTPTSGSIPGSSPSNPIILSPSGQLTMTFWRPQRAAIRSDETGYLDWGFLNYGVGVGDIQATCAGLYTNVSSELIADTTPFGTGDSILFNQGANPTPYRDSLGDRVVSAANTLAFTVDLKTCATRAGGSGTGTVMVSLEARGEAVTGGQTTARQMFYVQFQ